MRTTTLELQILRAQDGYLASLRAELDNADARLATAVAVAIDPAALRALETLPETYGEALTAMVFPAPLREAWARARGAHEADTRPLRLRLALDEADPALHALLWETLRDPLTRLPLARGEGVRLARYLPSAGLGAAQPLAPGALRAVVAVAAPAAAPPLDVGALTGAVLPGLAAIPSHVLDGATGRPPATLPNLLAALRDGPAILVLVCHARLVDGEPFLWLEQAAAPYRPVPASELVEAITQLARQPLLVVLAACESGGTSYEVLSAVGPQLARAGVGAVLAMREQIAQATVAALLPPLFAELRRDGAIDRALAAARAALGAQHPWWLPVLWMRARDGRLWHEGPGEAGEAGTRRLWTPYLERLDARLQRLPQRRPAARLDHGGDVALEQVFTMPATQSTTTLRRGARSQLSAYFADAGSLQPARPYDPELALPSAALVASLQVAGSASGDPQVLLLRSLLATEAVQQHPRLVMLGEPGSGKSTFLRYLAWDLARQGLARQREVGAATGEAERAPLLPIMLPLRRLAGRLVGAERPLSAITASLAEELEQEYRVAGSGALLDAALDAGQALLLLDGLDEVPSLATPTHAARTDVLDAVRALAELYPATHVVLSCRTRAFSAELHNALGWPVEHLAPFTMGQIRFFARAWFAALAERGGLVQAGSERQAVALLATLARSPRLRQLAANPLLLTMMVLVLNERGALPLDRPQLYEEMLSLLLGAWDEPKGIPGLAAALGVPALRLDDLRPILDQISFAAHAGELSPDGRGMLLVRDLRYTLSAHLEQAGVPDAWGAAGRCLAYLSERSGLLISEDDGASYRFAHRTLQEHGAGRHLLLQPGAVDTVMKLRADDRWREPIALGLGVIHQLFPALADRLDRVLTELIDRDEGAEPKSPARWYRDLIFAAEIGEERGWELLRGLVNVDRLRRELRRGLVALLADRDQPLPVAERVRAGFLLGVLGDPRFPATVEAWRREIARAQAGASDGYFCRVVLPGGRVIWIGRLPITNEQLQAWPQARTLLRETNADDPRFRGPNQPAAGVSWHLATQFCAWLSETTGASIRLPSEAEWEAAAGGAEGLRFPWGNQRLPDRAAIKADRDARGWPYTAPVGCYPAGASPVGALDMAGNVWEWTSDLWRPDRAANEKSTASARALRGGSYQSKKSQTSTTARIGLEPGISFDNGFRVVLETQRP